MTVKSACFLKWLKTYFVLLVQSAALDLTTSGIAAQQLMTEVKNEQTYGAGRQNTDSSVYCWTWIVQLDK